MLIYYSFRNLKISITFRSKVLQNYDSYFIFQESVKYDFKRKYQKQ